MKIILASLSLLLLTSCTTLPPSLSQTQNLSWKERVKILSHVNSWTAEGMVGIRTTQESLSAHLTWKQQQQNYVISLFGPLGTHSFMLKGEPHQAQLTLADGKHFVAHDPETLLAEQIGWHLPVSNLYYWIRGLPTPGTTAHYRFDTYHHIIQLEQESWHIQYLRYVSINGIDLPTKIVLDHAGITVKIAISQWKN